MKITKLILVGYHRFKLRQIHRLEYTPTKKTQVILGSNGSGKSSLLKELSPLPAHHSEFEKGGSKEIFISHKGRNYRLHCDFSHDGNRFIFEVDGENLNPGYTVTVYRELVKEHFNYTPEIHAIITGQTTFHELSVNDRRNWFTQLNETDFTYALKYFQQLKQTVRDTQSALKHTQSRLTEETNKLLDKEAELKLRIEVEELREDLHKFLSIRPPRQRNPSELEQAVKEVDASLQTVINELRSLAAQYETRTTSESRESLETLKNKLLMDFKSKEGTAVAMMQQITKMQQKANEFSGVGNCNLEDINKEIAALEAENLSIQKALGPDVANLYPDPSKSLQSLEWAKEYFSELSEKLRAFKRRNYTRFEQETLANQLQELQNEQLRFESFVKTAWQKVEVFQNRKLNKESECPKCHHKWIQDYDEVQHEQAILHHKTTVEAAEKHQAKVKSTTEQLNEISSFFQLSNDFCVFLSRYPELGGFFSKLQAVKAIEENPDQIPSLVEETIQQLKLLVQLHRNIEVLKDRSKIKTILEAASAEDLSKLNKVIEEENETLAKIQREMRHIQEEIKRISYEIEIRTSLQEAYRDFQVLLEERKRTHQAHIRDLMIAAMDEVIHNMRLDLSHKERQLNQIEIQKALVESLKKDADILARNYRLLSLSQEALSPATGLIAEGMMNFINDFVTKVNRFIEKIWLYPLEIIPVVPDEENGLDLDYKFEVSVNGEKCSPDIAKTSAGQKEIINLAFAAVCMKYLGLEDYPFFLDEFAVKMDAAHRKMAYEIIDYLIESSDFSQIFLISHYEQGYSSLSEAEILVLCDSNVILPKHLVYNEHVLIQ